jgi:mannose/fructose-specific phosphotransferase system component IIA
MSDAELVRGILLTHGSMCHGMIDAVRRITGVGDEALIGISNDGKNPEALLQAVREVTDDGPILIFTDMPSGSCAITARFVCTDPSNRSVLFGTNLPILLDFVFHRHLPLDQLVSRLESRGRASIRSLDPTAQHADRPLPG